MGSENEETEVVGQGGQGEQSSAEDLFGGAEDASTEPGSQTTEPNAGEDQPQTEEEPAGPREEATSLSKEDVASILANAMQQVQTPAPAPAQPSQEQQLSPQELKRMLNVYEPDAKVVDALLEGGPNAVAALQGVVEGIARQSVTMAQVQMQQAMEDYRQKLEQQVAPALQLAQRSADDLMKKEFFKQYPELASYEPLLIEIKNGMVASGQRFKSREDVFKAVANKARAVLKQAGLPQSTPKTGSNGHSMSTLASGGQGAASKDASGRQKSEVEDLWG